MSFRGTLSGPLDKRHTAGMKQGVPMTAQISSVRTAGLLGCDLELPPRDTGSELLSFK